MTTPLASRRSAHRPGRRWFVAVAALVVLGAGNLNGHTAAPAEPADAPSAASVIPAATQVEIFPAAPVEVAAPAAAPEQAPPPAAASLLPDQRAVVAIRTALGQLGLPYVWGG